MFVCPCVCVLQNENLEGEHRRRPWVNSNSFSHEKNFLRSLNLLRETWKRSTFLGRMSLSCKARMIVLFQDLEHATSRTDDSQLSFFSPHTTCTCEDSTVICWNTCHHWYIAPQYRHRHCARFVLKSFFVYKYLWGVSRQLS